MFVAQNVRKGKKRHTERTFFLSVSSFVYLPFWPQTSSPYLQEACETHHVCSLYINCDHLEFFSVLTLKPNHFWIREFVRYDPLECGLRSRRWHPWLSAHQKNARIAETRCGYSSVCMLLNKLKHLRHLITAAACNIFDVRLSHLFTLLYREKICIIIVYMVNSRAEALFTRLSIQ